jgi:hypothetical protein
MDSPNNTCGVELYSPHFAARQFGLVQGVPCPIMYTSNNQFFFMRIFRQKEEIEEVDKINEALFCSFDFVPFELSCLVTKDFYTWWSGYAAKVFHKPVTEVLEGFSFEKNPKASGKKESSQPTTSKGKAHRTNPVLPFLRGGPAFNRFSNPVQLQYGKSPSSQ